MLVDLHSNMKRLIHESSVQNNPTVAIFTFQYEKINTAKYSQDSPGQSNLHSNMKRLIPKDTRR